MSKRNIKKGTALLLTASMLLGLSLSALDSIDAHAESSTPSLSAYASKEELQNSFAPKEDGTAEEDNIGKLIFGKNEDGDVQEWYILGKDDGVEGDNTAIFAASNMISYKSETEPSVKFEDNSNTDKDYKSDTDMGTYEEGKKPTKVSPNHYGASDIRQVLRQVAGEEDIDDNVTNISADRYSSNKKTKLFSEAELKLLQATTVRTDDFRGNSQSETVSTPNYYTTSDKLYLGAWDYDGQQSKLPPFDRNNKDAIYIGSEDGKKVLTGSTYWKQPASWDYEWFWLRSPYSGSYDCSLDAYTGFGVSICLVDYGSRGVRPASNLNLSSVLFASSTTAAAGSSAESGSAAGAAMRLRLDGANKNIGSVALSGDVIKVIRNSTGETVSLVVQGKTGDTDWYYSEVIEQADEGKKVEIAKDTINDRLEGIGSEVIDLLSCKIWLEIKDSEDGMLYAVEATKSTAPEECDHKYQPVAKINPTRTEPGYKKHYECSRCGKLFMLIAGKHIEVTEADLLIPPTGNSSSSGSGGSSSVSTGWIKDSKGWKYRNSDGMLAKGTTVTDADGERIEKVLWQKAGNGYYAFGSDGYLVTGWIYDKLEDKWYYCDENNGKLYGWLNSTEDGYWYYLSPSTGEALTGWHSINGKDYYFASAPAAPTYSFDAATDTWIYSNLNGNRPFGSMYANTVTPDNYTVDASGAWMR